jgi:F-type H+-transporting ATPase subunit a
MADAHHVPDPIHHVVDEKEHWHLFDRLFGGVDIPLPHFELLGHEFRLTKFMILELLAAVLIAAIFIPIARRSRGGALPKGSWWNCFEVLLTFIRNEVAKPNIGDKDADRFVPYLWTVFLCILFLNLLGMFPWMGSPTASISVTGALAVLSFLLFHAVPIAKYGVTRYVKSMWLDTGLPWYTGLPIVIALLILFIELLGTAIKAFVLAVRLYANMFAGHMVLAMILTFIVIVGNKGYTNLWPVVTVASVLGVVALSLLELFVAFLQAFVFTFLTSLFVGMAMHHCEEHEHAHEGEHAHEHAGAHGHGR